MFTLYSLKPRFQSCLRPTVKRLAGWGVTPNQVTVLAMLISFAAGACVYGNPYWKWPLLLVPVALLVRMALNAIDGMLAREHDMQTKRGALLNEMGDVLSDLALYAPLAYIPGVQSSLVAWVLVGTVLSEFAGVLAQAIGSARRYDGPMGKSDRAFMLGGLYLLLGLGASPYLWWVDGLLTLTAALLIVTIYKRCIYALR